nr:K(+) efflux antiporter 3, chloroplastic isoform X4 [Arachis hypogaea]
MLESLAGQSFKLKGYDLIKDNSPKCYAISSFSRSSIFKVCSDKKQVSLLSLGVSYRSTSVSENLCQSKLLNVPSFYSWKGFYLSKYTPLRFERLQTSATYDVAGAVEVIHDLGLDTLTFLAVTVLIVPTFKSIKASPVNIRSIDEAVVIAAALSLSSSAFVLQLLAEKGELPTRFGSATLGILLLQDIAVVPLLVILPILESQNLAKESIWPMLAQESLKALGGLGLLSFGGKYILRRVFEVVADARSSEAFVALCLLTVAGTSLVTQHLGFSDTLGAFLAGALLAETNFRTQIEADIRPFRGLLIGLFFLTTGTSIDMQLLMREWPHVLALLAGLISIKTLIITAIGPCVGLSLQESVRIGLLLSQGGEFGFVVFSLANRLGVLPLELNKLLIIVVVLSMALTPFLNEAGRRAADFIDGKFDVEFKASEMVNFGVTEPVVIVGFGQMGQVLANFLSNPLASGGDSDAAGWPYVAFDLDPALVNAAKKAGFPIHYGDGSHPAVLQSAGISSPKAIMVMFTGKEKTAEAVQRLRFTYPAIPIYARAKDLEHLLDLKKAGATDAVLENAEISLQLGSKLLKGFGVMSDDLAFLSQLIRDSMELQAQEAASFAKCDELNMMKQLQVEVRIGDSIEGHAPMPTTSSELDQPHQVSLPRIQPVAEQPVVEQDDELDQTERRRR